MLCLEFWWKAKTKNWMKTEHLRGIECAWTQHCWHRGTKMSLGPLAEPGRGSPGSQCLMMVFFFPGKIAASSPRPQRELAPSTALHCYCWPCSTHLGCIYWLLRSCKGLEQSGYLIFLSHVLIKGLQRAREHLLPQPCLRRPPAKLNKRALHLLLVWFFCNVFYYLFEGVN